MTIKEVEELTGLSRSNVRFYEKERLIFPSRNEKNGYRDYSESDVENIKKIAYLRTLGISIEDIRNIIEEKESLHKVIQNQKEILKKQLSDLDRAKILCEKMLRSNEMSYKEFQVEKYVNQLQEYWDDNKPVFRLDSVSFLYIWGSFITWVIIAALCLLVGLWSYGKLPPEIPVQWNHGVVSSLVDKKFIFAYPVACVILRYLIRPANYAQTECQFRYCGTAIP
ncbi:MAG: MerR family transcriptional regulator, partial [Blautia producta]